MVRFACLAPAPDPKWPHNKLFNMNKEKRFSKQLRSVLSFVIVCAQKKRQQSKVEQMRYPNKSYSALCLTSPDRSKNTIPNMEYLIN